MKIGYPCVNLTIGCRTDKKFRVSSYTKKKLIETSSNNLECLKSVLEFNIKNNLLFFRISSDTIPLASHPICTINWEKYLKKELQEIGDIIKEKNVRISMHPGQYVVLNSLKEETILNSVRELEYHAKLLNGMKLDNTAKVQIHVGGVYGDKEAATKRFIKTYNRLNMDIKERLVIEHDEKSYSLKDCSRISEKTGIPIVFDTLHHKYNNSNETIIEGIQLARKSWKEKDGLQMIDYSDFEKGSKKGKHASTINNEAFKTFLEKTKDLDFDIMLEIKDKERSALEAIEIIKEMGKT